MSDAHYSLTPEQNRLYRYLEGRLATGDVGPSYDEMVRDLGLKSRGRAHALVVGLEQRGVIERLPRKRRAIRLIPRKAASCPHCGAAQEPATAQGED